MTDTPRLPPEDEEAKILFDGFKRVVDACSALSVRDQLAVLELAWLAAAEQARNNELALPDGFPAEQARQLETLEKMALLVRGSLPDLELVRLQQEGDIEGVIRHLRALDGGGSQ